DGQRKSRPLTIPLGWRSVLTKGEFEPDCCKLDMPESEQFLKGQLLLDSGQLRGSFFQRTVVLICQHDAEGAFGLVLNRAAGSNIGETIVADLPDALKTNPLYLGGPVQPSALSFLHTDSFIPDANVI